MILMIDHEDSFTYNLVHYIEDLDEKVKVVQHDEITVQMVKELKPKAVILSPGPGHPKDKTNSIELVQQLKGELPILGVCLGFQIIVYTFGGDVTEATRPMHGRTDLVIHDRGTIYTSFDQPIQVTRYHSLIADSNTLPNEIKVTGKSPNGEIMSCRHLDYPIEGVQYHPEAILTTHGKKLLHSFLNTYCVGVKVDETASRPF